MILEQIKEEFIKEIDKCETFDELEKV